MREIKFGNYLQNNQIAEPIEWIVLEEKDNKCLLTTKYGIDAQVYHTSDGNIAWKDSYIRNWLNNEFYNSAFSSAEKMHIDDIILAENCNDKVFLLSRNETSKYFLSINSNKIMATPYTRSKGIDVGQSGWVSYWLRDTGYCIDDTWGTIGASIYGSDGYMLSIKFAIRPAIWITL